VRVVEIKDQGETFSAELCGGTHVHHTGEIGFVHILRESAVAAGTRRIEALTGRAAEAHLLEQQERLERVAHKLGANTADVEERIDTMQSELERLRKQSDQLQRLQGSAVAEALIEQAEKRGDDFLIVACVDVTSNDALKEVADRVRAKLKPALVILGAAIEGRPSFLAAATPDLVQRGVNAGNIVREVAKAAGGGGGGRPDLAQAGARDLSRLDAAIDTARKVGAAALTTTQGS
jgi:alanyl-tRNA synthetase